MKRVLAALTAAVIAFTALPVTSHAATAVSTETRIYVNPIYADVISESDLADELLAGESAKTDRNAKTYNAAPSKPLGNSDDIGAYLREQEKARVTEIAVPFAIIAGSKDELSSILNYAVWVAEKHTGNPDEGDYLRYNREGYSMTMTYTLNDGLFTGTATYKFAYFTNASQEQAVTNKIKNVMSSLSLSGKSTEDVLKAIYGYITGNVKYDNTHPDTYLLKFSTYAALINGTAVCQGYSSLFYRMALEAGIDSRIIAGTSKGQNHAWNLAQISKLYYNLDSTFDSSLGSTFASWKYFLKSDADFLDHIRTSEYSSDSFYQSYPMTKKSYDGSSSTYKDMEWDTVGGKSYWYEKNIRQGTSTDSKCFSYDGTLRGREIYDPKSDGWYWLDVNANGAKAIAKEVFMPYIYQEEDNWSASQIKSNAASSGANAAGNVEHAELADQVEKAIKNKTGKWVRYDGYGKMMKGWVTIEGGLVQVYPNQAGNTYYYDRMTGLMAKGETVIDGVTYYFDEVTGALKK